MEAALYEIKRLRKKGRELKTNSALYLCVGIVLGILVMKVF